MSDFTGRIHHGQSTITAMFYNSSQDNEFGMSERDLSDYIDVTEGSGKQKYITAMVMLQNYKNEHGIELDYLPYKEWDL